MSRSAQQKGNRVVSSTHIPASTPRHRTRLHRGDRHRLQRGLGRLLRRWHRRSDGFRRTGYFGRTGYDDACRTGYFGCTGYEGACRGGHSSGQRYGHRHHA
jgi:hypothetical protein